MVVEQLFQQIRTPLGDADCEGFCDSCVLSWPGGAGSAATVAAVAMVFIRIECGVVCVRIYNSKLAVSDKLNCTLVFNLSSPGSPPQADLFF